jgi:hypothetical protein
MISFRNRTSSLFLVETKSTVTDKTNYLPLPEITTDKEGQQKPPVSSSIAHNSEVYLKLYICLIRQCIHLF